MPSTIEVAIGATQEATGLVGLGMFRIEAHAFLGFGERLAGRFRQGQGDGAAAVCDGQTGFELDRLIEVGERAFGAAVFAQQAVGPLDIEHGEVGLDRDCRGGVGNGAVVVALAAVARRPSDLVERIARIHHDRLAEVLERALVVALCLIGLAACGVMACPPRVAADQLAQVGDGEIEVAALLVGRGALEQCLRITRLEPDHFAEIADRRIEIALEIAFGGEMAPARHVNLGEVAVIELQAEQRDFRDQDDPRAGADRVRAAVAGRAGREVAGWRAGGEAEGKPEQQDDVANHSFTPVPIRRGFGRRGGAPGSRSPGHYVPRADFFGAGSI
jgi:hypothetical protein